MDRRQVYLDFAATTPVDPEVLDAMLPWLRDDFGNPSSIHAAGRRARAAVEASRDRVADLLGASPSEIVFTSGGTESNNLALAGLMSGGGTIVTSRIEHEAVLQPVRRLNEMGCDVRFVPCRRDGTVDPGDLSDMVSGAASGRTLVSLMHVNNETGAVNDVAKLAEVAHEAGALVHTDAVQSAGLMEVSVERLGVDLMSLSAHKMYGPKGAGVLFVGSPVPVEGQLLGGSQERARRAGTENVAAIVGLAKAFEMAAAGREAASRRLSSLRDRMIGRFQQELGDEMIVNTPMTEYRAAPHIVNVSVRAAGGVGVDGEMLLLSLDLEGICASSGSACSSGTLKPSHVLTEIGRSPEEAAASVRFSLGASTTEADVDYAVELFGKIVQRLRRVANKSGSTART